MYRGRLFQSFGPATANALSPMLFSITRGTTKSKWSADLRALDGVYWLIRSDKYLGARPLREKKKFNIIKLCEN